MLKDLLSYKFRLRRARLLSEFLVSFEPPINVLDVGGTADFWDKFSESIDKKINVTILNIDLEDRQTSYRLVRGDARSLPFKDNMFDVIFSNSLIEHFGSFNDQQKVAREIRRVGKRYFIQTPNRNFAIEPHFVFPFFQFLPLPMKIFLLQKFNLGWVGRIKDKKLAEETVSSFRLLNFYDLKALFPDGEIINERLLGLTKSFIIFK